MKFSSATLLILASSVAAFSFPAFSPRTSTVMSMSAVQTPTYTFTKSEEIFAEAKEVSTCLWRSISRIFLNLSNGSTRLSIIYHALLNGIPHFFSLCDMKSSILTF